MATVSLLHFNGTDASTTFTDVSGKTWVAVNQAQLDTAQKKFGTASLLLDGTGDSITSADSTDWDLGAGDFTIDMWVRFAALPADANNMRLLDRSHTDDSGYSIVVVNTSGTYSLLFQNYTGAGYSIQISKNLSGLSIDTWYHFEIDRSGSDFHFFLGGTQQGTTGSDADTTTDNSAVLRLGTDRNGNAGLNGWIDEFRLVKGTAKHTSNFTPETTEYPDYSPSPSVSVSLSPSLTPSLSISLSQSLSQSLSISLSPSSSPSFSGSNSLSPSPSTSVSVSISISPSTSISVSESASISHSATNSSSPSISSSLSPSSTLSASPSSSTSPSASPSAGFAMFTHDDQSSLPSNDNDLTTQYTEQEEEDVSVRDDTRVGQAGTLQYMIHQFKKFVGSQTYALIEAEVQSTLDPRYSTVYLQIYNRNSSTWETIDSNSTSDSDVDFELSAVVSDLTNYKDASNVVSCRIYQLAI